MPLVSATVKSTIKAQLDAQYGAPADAEAVTEQDKFCTALANAIISILTTQQTITITDPVSGPLIGVVT